MAPDDSESKAGEADERLAHEPEAALAAAVLDPGHAAPLTFPDDDDLVRFLRKGDRIVGLGEQIVLFALLATMVIVACVEAIAERMHSGFLWSFDVVRDATFARRSQPAYRNRLDAKIVMHARKMRRTMRALWPWRRETRSIDRLRCW